MLKYEKINKKWDVFELEKLKNLKKFGTCTKCTKVGKIICLNEVWLKVAFSCMISKYVK